VVRSDAVAEVKRLKALPGKHMVLWGSLSLAQALMETDLIDEYHLQLCPTAAGGGRPLFPGREGCWRFKRVARRTYDTGVVFLNYEPVRGGS
jgi:dihydrofolate reductase